jgi:predicted  nucleic acid-binding Zn-ribbon protein
MFGHDENGIRVSGISGPYQNKRFFTPKNVIARAPMAQSYTNNILLSNHSRYYQDQTETIKRLHHDIQEQERQRNSDSETWGAIVHDQQNIIRKMGKGMSRLSRSKRRRKATIKRLEAEIEEANASQYAHNEQWQNYCSSLQARSVHITAAYDTKQTDHAR